MVLGEERRFAHLRVHVVPLMPGVADDAKGADVVRLLGGTQGDGVSEEERDRLTLERRARIRPALA